MTILALPPTEQVTPYTAEALAEILRDASTRGQAVVPWGAGTLQHLGNHPPSDFLAVKTTALDRIVEYTPADLTITVEVGVTLGAVQETLRPHGQWLPWDPPAPNSATIGGLLAAGVSGPLRLGYGTPRDWVLGMRMALGDGRLIKSGGKVVKNVAGYDLHKLQIGALGTLGVIVEVTFKLAPLPDRIGSLALTCARRADALALAEQLRAPPLAPTSLALVEHVGSLLGDLPGSPDQTRLVARFAGVAAGVERQLHAATAIARTAGALPVALSDEQSQAIWRSLATIAMPGPEPREALLLRAGAPAASLPATMDALQRHAPPAGEPIQIVGYGGVGLAYARWPLPDSIQVETVTAALAALRSALARDGGYVVVEGAPAALRPYLDIWGAPPETLALMQALKAQWDPRGILNPGRYVGGL